MPGRIVTLGGEGFPPDWIQLGYTTTPASVINGFNVARQIIDSINNRPDYVTQFDAADFPGIVYFPGNSVLDTAGMTSFYFNDSSLEYIDFVFPSSTINYLLECFKDCHALRYAKIRFEDGISVSDARYLFNNCDKMYHCDIDISNLGNLEKLSYAFEGCEQLESITLENESLDDANHMLLDCTAIKEVNINFPNASYANNICENAAHDHTNGKFTVSIGADSTVCNYEEAFKGANISKKASIITLDHGYSFNSCFENAYVRGTIRTTRREGAYSDDMTSMFKGANIKADLELITNDEYSSGNCTSMFEDAYIYNEAADELLLPTNCNAMFKGSTFSMPDLGITGYFIFHLDTSNCEDFREMFMNSNVNRIHTVPSLISATQLDDMFKNTHITNTDTLNKLLLRLVNADAYTGTKTLAHLGFDSTNYPAATIQALSNYAAFTAAGWSIGY